MIKFDFDGVICGSYHKCAPSSSPSCPCRFCPSGRSPRSPWRRSSTLRGTSTSSRPARSCQYIEGATWKNFIVLRKNQTNEPHPSVFTLHCSHLPSLRPYCRSVMKIFRNAGHFRFSIDGPLTLGTSGPASFVESFESSDQVKTPQSYGLSKSRHHKVFVWASQDTILFWANPIVTLQVFTRSTSFSLTFTVIFPSKGAGGGLSHIGPGGYGVII